MRKQNPIAKTNQWIRIAQALLLVNALIWVVLGIWYFVRFQDAQPLVAISAIAIMMVANAVVFLAIAWGIGRRSTLAYYFGVLFLIGHIVLTITDQVGLIDFVILMLDLILLTIFLNKRADLVKGSNAHRS